MTTDYSKGAAYLDGAFMPLAEARIPVTHFGYRRSDVTYDVVGVWEGNFFRLDDHIRRFRASMDRLRMTPPESDADIRGILNRLVAMAGLRSSYVAMDCLRATPPPGRAEAFCFCAQLSLLLCRAMGQHPLAGAIRAGSAHVHPQGPAYLARSL